jgi:heme/copper-type cytochrome/quinol oxidase subunit 2
VYKGKEIGPKEVLLQRPLLTTPTPEENLLPKSLDQKNESTLFSFTPLTPRTTIVDNILVLKSEAYYEVITSSFDVIHSWFVPALG